VTAGVRPSPAESILPPLVGFALTLTPPYMAFLIVRPENLLPTDLTMAGLTILGRVALFLQLLPAALWSVAALIVVEVVRRRFLVWHTPAVAGVIASYLLFLPFSCGSWFLGMGVLEWEAATPAGQGCGNPFFGWFVMQVASFSFMPIGFLVAFGGVAAWRKLSRAVKS
jgi:hypothetical protein